VNINTTLEAKIQAVQINESETHTFPHTRSSESFRAIAQGRGSMVGLKSAEALELVRSKRLVCEGSDL